MKSKHSETEPTCNTFSLRRYCWWILGATMLYSAAMAIALQLDRPTHSGRTLFEKVVIEAYDWFIFPTAVLQYVCRADTKLGLAAVVLGAGTVCALAFVSIAFLIRRGLRGLTSGSQRE